jgi:hypothetical protein
MASEKKITPKYEFIRCLMVVVAAYLIAYLLLAGRIWGFFNPWLIGIMLFLLITDIVILRKLITRYFAGNEDDY